jgi:hypothetical protein
MVDQKVALDAAEVALLVAQVRDDDASMSPAPWRFDQEVGEIISEPMRSTWNERAEAAVQSGTAILTDLMNPCVLLAPTDKDGRVTERGSAYAAGAASMRNSAAAMANKLETLTNQLASMRNSAAAMANKLKTLDDFVTMLIGVRWPPIPHANQPEDVGKPRSAEETAEIKTARGVHSATEVIALIDVADAVTAWREAACDTQSTETDDHVIASMQGECAGDTHEKSCPVEVARHALIDALDNLKAVRWDHKQKSAR